VLQKPVSVDVYFMYLVGREAKLREHEDHRDPSESGIRDGNGAGEVDQLFGGGIGEAGGGRVVAYTHGLKWGLVKKICTCLFARSRCSNRGKGKNQDWLRLGDGNNQMEGRK
jgi:hypothetical protein